jgi:hypothetical protein
VLLLLSLAIVTLLLRSSEGNQKNLPATKTGGAAELASSLRAVGIKQYDGLAPDQDWYDYGTDGLDVFLGKRARAAVHRGVLVEVKVASAIPVIDPCLEGWLAGTLVASLKG